MTDNELIVKIAHLWIENGGDAEGLSWCWERIRQAVQDEINSRQALVSPAPADQVQPPLVRLCPRCHDEEKDYELSVIA